MWEVFGKEVCDSSGAEVELAGEVAHWHGITLGRRADELPSL